MISPIIPHRNQPFTLKISPELELNVLFPTTPTFCDMVGNLKSYDRSNAAKFVPVLKQKNGQTAVSLAFFPWNRLKIGTNVRQHVTNMIALSF